MGPRISRSPISEDMAMQDPECWAIQGQNLAPSRVNLWSRPNVPIFLDALEVDTAR